MMAMHLYDTALYYPYVDIDDPRWLRTAVLFWDHIQTIVPTEIEQPYRNRESQLVQDAGFLSPLACDLHGELLEDMSRRVIRFSEDPKIIHSELSEVYGACAPARLPRQEPDARALNSVARSRLHRGKIGSELLERFGNLDVDADGFLLIDGPFARFYMSSLATRLASDTGTIAVSSERDVLRFRSARYSMRSCRRRIQPRRGL